MEFLLPLSSYGCNLWLERRTNNRLGRSPGGSPVAVTFDEKERMVVARINRICIFAITNFTVKFIFII